MELQPYERLAVATRYFQIEQKLEDRVRIEMANWILLKSEFEEKYEKRRVPYHNVECLSYLLVFGGGIWFIAGLIALAMMGVSSGVDVAVVVLPLVIGILLCWYANSAIKSINKEKNEKKETELEPQLKEIGMHLKEANAALKKFHEENSELVAFLPKQYANLEAVSFMLVAIHSGRADSLKEVYNLYEEQLHRWKLEEAANQSAQAQEYMNIAIDELNAKQAQTNNLLRGIGLLQYMQYLNGN